MTQHPSALPPEITVLERGWLSANNILFIGQHDTAIVDTGYCSHADQTVDLVRGTLQGRALDRILNTHLHSDHCGGNAALQKTWPGVLTAIPPGQADHVRQWDAYALSFTPPGRSAHPFGPTRCWCRARVCCWATSPGRYMLRRGTTRIRWCFSSPRAAC